MTANQGLPVADGLLELADSGPFLLGSRCQACETRYFPQVKTCRNPACHAGDVRRVRLPRTGTLYSFTVQRYRPPPLYRSDDWAPYAIGLVDLGDGLRVLGRLDVPTPEDCRIGMAVELSTERLFIDDAGQPIITHCFVRAAEPAA